MKMKLKDHKGFKRLAVLIALIIAVVTYILLIVNEGNPSDELIFIGFPFAAILISLGTYIFIRIIYWVIDGFRMNSNKTTDDDDVGIHTYKSGSILTKNCPHCGAKNRSEEVICIACSKPIP
jgi:hypothetical protein